MRFSALLPLLCALAAMVLSFLCIFAGSTTSFLQNADLLTLNTSRIGHGEAFNTSDGSGGLLSNLVNSVESDLNDLINNATSDIARAVNLHDFYSVHILNYCEGYYTPNATAAPGYKPEENVTECANRSALFHFDPTRILENELAPGYNLSFLQWPDQIEKASHVLRTASTVMFILYCIGIGFSAFAAVAAVVGILTSGRISAFLNFVLDIIAFLALGVASGIATAIIVKLVEAVNHYGADIGIAAYRGSYFLGLTWAATGVMLLASMYWMFQCCAGRKKERGFVEKPAY